MTDEAILTNSSLKLEIIASEPIHFGFLKCGIYSLATHSKIRNATYIFEDSTLQNIKNMINRSCASDSHTESFDIVISSKEQTNVALNFSISSEAEKSSLNLDSMYSDTVNFNIPPFSNRQYPIQIKSLVLEVLREKGSVLHVFTESGIPLNFTMRRCVWETPGFEIYDRMEVKNIFDLLQHSCDSDWLTDTVNIFIPNSEYESLIGSLRFKVISESEIVVKSQTLSLISNKTEKSIAAFHVIKTNEKSFIDTYGTAILIFVVSLASAFLLYFLVLFTYRRLFRYGSYNVMDHENYRLPTYPSESLDSGIQLTKYEVNSFDCTRL